MKRRLVARLRFLLSSGLIVSGLMSGMLVCAGSLLAQRGSKSAGDLAPGRFLVSSRDVGDPNFAETVILLIDYDRKGAMGLIVNRRTKVPLSRVLDDINSAKDRSDPVFVGGPVSRSSAFAMVRSRTKIGDSHPAVGDIYLLSEAGQLEKFLAAGTDSASFRVYLGYAGWGPGQLDHEMELGGWRIFAGDPGLVFDPDPPSVWERLIRQADLRIALLLHPR